MRGYASCRWGQVHFRAEGVDGADAARPTALLFHESPQSSAIFERTLPLLGERLSAYAFDTPGYGHSDPPPGPQSVPEYAAAMLETASSLGVDRFAAVGVHTGTGIALQMAAQAPERVSHLVISGTPGAMREWRAGWLASPPGPIALAEDGSHLRDQWRTATTRGGGADLALATLMTTSVLRIHERWGWALDGVARHDPEPDLRALSCPVLVLGVEFDTLIEEDRDAALTAPGARFELFEGLPGQLPWRAPHRFAREVADFVTAP